MSNREVALHQALSALQVNETLTDNTPLGANNYWVRVQYGVGTGRTAIPIQLTRNPSGMIEIDNSTGAVIYRTAQDRIDSGPSVYVCRATSGVSISAIFL